MLHAGDYRPPTALRQDCRPADEVLQFCGQRDCLGYVDDLHFVLENHYPCSVLAVGVDCSAVSLASMAVTGDLIHRHPEMSPFAYKCRRNEDALDIGCPIPGCGIT